MQCQKMTQTGVVYDGLFFDNFELTISTYNRDYAGNPVQINDNYPGPADGAAALDARWSAGMLTLMSEFRKMAPQAWISVHAPQSRRIRARSPWRTASRWSSIR